MTTLLNKVYEHEYSELDPVLEALQALVYPARGVVMNTGRDLVGVSAGTAGLRTRLSPPGPDSAIR